MEESIKPIVSQDGNMDQDVFDEPVLANIREHWDWVKEGIVEAVSDYLVGLDGLRIEDIYAACANNQAQLWVTKDGFVITTGVTEQYTNERLLLIWVAWARTRGRNLAVAHTPFFEKQAKDAGFSKLQLKTVTSEVGEYVEANGWERKETVFTRDL